MKQLRLIAGLALAMFAVAGLSGCATMGPQVWERDVLSKPEMQMDGAVQDRAIDDHIYFSKEASSGGRSFGGGGCGCN